MSALVLRGRKVVGGMTEGEALVTRQTISTWGGVNAVKGIITERRHELRGQSFKDKVLVFPSAKGSSGWSRFSLFTTWEWGRSSGARVPGIGFRCCQC